MRPKADKGWSVGKRADGRVFIKVRVEKGKWRQLSTKETGPLKTERDAELWVLRNLDELKRSGKVDARRWSGDTPTIAVLFQRWKERKAADQTLTTGQKHTAQNYQLNLRIHMMPTLGERHFEELKPSDLVNWIEQLKSQLAPNTVRGVFLAFATLWRDSFVWEWTAAERLTRNELVTSALPSQENLAPEIVALSWPQAMRLLALNKIPLRRSVVYAIAVFTGLRINEIAGLEWSDWQEREGAEVLRIARGCGRDGKTGSLKTKATRRLIPVHPTLRLFLAEWKAEWPIRYGRSPLPDDPLFPREKTLPSIQHVYLFTANPLPRDFEAAGLPTRIGDSGLSIHSFRRTFITALEDANVPDNVISSLAGHSQKNIEGMHYSVSLLSRLRAFIEMLPAPSVVRTMVQTCTKDDENHVEQSVDRVLSDPSGYKSCEIVPYTSAR